MSKAKEIRRKQKRTYKKTKKQKKPVLNTAHILKIG